MILNGTIHDNQSFFGFRNYTGLQKTFYANLIYQNIFGNTNHQYKAGLSYLLDDYNETLSGVNPRIRQESVLGAFFEYSYTIPEKLTVIAGGRWISIIFTEQDLRQEFILSMTLLKMYIYGKCGAKAAGCQPTGRKITVFS
ncbi:MAG: TonB-dependent receptor [Cytophagaceae bacterium]|nr:TonB-dependent receptor [Cytophagaceae bacterium]